VKSTQRGRAYSFDLLNEPDSVGREHRLTLSNRDKFIPLPGSTVAAIH